MTYLPALSTRLRTPSSYQRPRCVGLMITTPRLTVISAPLGIMMSLFLGSVARAMRRTNFQIGDTDPVVGGFEPPGSAFLWPFAPTLPEPRRTITERHRCHNYAT